MADKSDDGGPAFPFEFDDNVGARCAHAGMTLLDHFAGLAMQSIFAGPAAQSVADRDSRYDGTTWAEVVAANAYEMAAAMIAERKNKS